MEIYISIKRRKPTYFGYLKQHEELAKSYNILQIIIKQKDGEVREESKRS